MTNVIFPVLSLISVIYLIWIVYVLKSSKYDEMKIKSSHTIPSGRFANKFLEYSLGSGCDLLQYDPFDEEVVNLDERLADIKCESLDWVKCQNAQCTIDKEVFKTKTFVKCIIRDVITIDDATFKFGKPVLLRENGVYVLNNSDHILVKCAGTFYDKTRVKKSWLALFSHLFGKIRVYWKGNLMGIRQNVQVKKPPLNREASVDILVLVVGSTSANRFLRNMTETAKLLPGMGFVVFNGFNTLGSNPDDFLYPLLTGRNKDEYLNESKTFNRYNEPFLFNLLRDDGYRTAYFDEDPNASIFGSRLDSKLPDHYSKPTIFYAHRDMPKNSYCRCIGELPVHEMIFNLTFEFFKLSGKKLCVSYVSSVACSDECGVTSSADDAAARLLRRLALHRDIDQALLVLVGDHGDNGKLTFTYQGRYEQRKPLLAIKLPKKLSHLKQRLLQNKDVLTTPYDLHTTMMEALDLSKHANKYKVKNSKFYRGLSLFRQIPNSRSCADAHIIPEYCSCPIWENISYNTDVAKTAVAMFVRRINEFTQGLRNVCEPLTLASVLSVKRQITRLHYENASENLQNMLDYLLKPNNVYIKLSVILKPSGGIYRALLKLQENKSEFHNIVVLNIKRHNSCLDKTDEAYLFCHCR